MIKLRHYLLITFTVFTVLNTPLYALPRFAVMKGMKCASCHVNPTGGEMRNENGTAFSLDELPMKETKDEDFAFNPKLTDNITLGMDYRSQMLYYDDPSSVTFQSMTASLYGAVKINKKVTFYFKQDLDNNYTGYIGGIEAFTIARVLPSGGYVKGGMFMPNYGLRLDDHTAYTRGGNLGFIGTIPPGMLNQGLIFVPNYKDIGMEVGSYFGSLFVTAALLKGNGNFDKYGLTKDLAYVGKAEYGADISSSLHSQFAGSFYGYKNYNMYGINAGIGTEDISFLAEVDWTKNGIGGTDAPVPFSSRGGAIVVENIKQMAAHGELTYRIMQGCSVVGTYDVYDPNQGIEFNNVSRTGIGFELFPNNFMEIRPQVRNNNVNVAKNYKFNNTEVIIQSHIWF